MMMIITNSNNNNNYYYIEVAIEGSILKKVENVRSVVRFI